MNEVFKSKKCTRARVIITLEKVLSGQSLASLLDDLLASVGEKDKGFAHELTLGTLRQWWALSRIGERLIEKELTDQTILAALNIGLYQLLYMNTPDYASINATLDALKALDKGYGVGLVNAILRKVAKSPAKYAKKVRKNHSLPNWLAYQLKQDWGVHYETLGQTLRTSAPIFVRANDKKITHDDYVNKLAVSLDKSIDDVAQATLETEVGFYEINGIQITRAIRLEGGQVTNLVGFAEGQIIIQDLHAQLSGAILKAVMVDRSNQGNKTLNLLDACTAPGGKLCHWLNELGDDVYCTLSDFILTAIDSDEKRLKRVYDNINRLGFSGLINDSLLITKADAATFKSDTPFDVIMLDAPCSATGVIRRHPDISLLRKPDDVAAVVALQRGILDNLWPQVARGGFLLYVTCSILKAENETQMYNFLARHDDAIEVPLYGTWGISQRIGRQCLPLSQQGGDGFYYALLQKI